MRKLNLSAAFIISSILCSLLQSCQKDFTAKQSAGSVSVNSNNLSANQNVNGLANPSNLVGAYTVRDEKTIYMGQANASGSNVFIHLDYIDVTKNIALSANTKSLTSDYGPETDNTKGWKYLIIYNPKTKLVILKPNDVMLAGIVTGSFKQLFANYDAENKMWTFVTRYTGLKDNGNESEVSETFWKQ